MTGTQPSTESERYGQVCAACGGHYSRHKLFCPDFPVSLPHHGVYYDGCNVPVGVFVMESEAERYAKEHKGENSTFEIKATLCVPREDLRGTNFELLHFQGHDKTIQTQIRSLLESPVWPEGVEPVTHYERQSDDNPDRVLRVMIDRQGDVYVSTCHHDSVRFCTLTGGGRSRRTRAALLILAQAIRLDAEERP